MRRFFWDGASDGGFAVLTGSEARHLREVLRISVGHEVILCDGAGRDFSAVTEQIGRDCVRFRLSGEITENSEPKLNVTLFLAHTKGDRLDFAVQKAVEIGASAVKLFRGERCIALTGDGKLARLNRIAFEASKQCGRSRLVRVEDAGTMSDALRSGDALKLFCCEWETAPIRGKLSPLPADVSVMCGPEGGFTQEEADAAREAGWVSVSLGKRILRAETAPIAALTVLLYENHDI